MRHTKIQQPEIEANGLNTCCNMGYCLKTFNFAFKNVQCDKI